jgi:hypothetical protein
MLRPGVPVRKQGAEHGLERVHPEPLPPELGGCLRRRPQPPRERKRPVALRLELLDRRRSELVADAVGDEEPANALVAVAPGGERGRT